MKNLSLIIGTVILFAQATFAATLNCSLHTNQTPEYHVDKTVELVINEGILVGKLELEAHINGEEIFATALASANGFDLINLEILNKSTQYSVEMTSTSKFVASLVFKNPNGLKLNFQCFVKN